MADFTFSEKFLRDFDSVVPIGAGGMAQVYRARQIALNRPVAVKVIHPDFFLFPESKERFFREGKVAAQLRHPNIVGLLAADEDKGQPYLVFELIEGQTLRDVLAQQTRFTTRRALQIVRDIAAGLAEAHAHKIIHRDLKPDNVLIDASGQVKVADFGLAREAADGSARLTQKGVLLGTPGYIAPELIKGVEPSPQSDVYACGILLFELLTGELPFRAKSDKDMLLRCMREQIPSPTTKGVLVHPSVEQLLATAVTSDPKRRFHDGRALHRALCEVLAALPEGQTETQAMRLMSAKGSRPPSRTVVDMATAKTGTARRWSRGQRAAAVLVPVVLGIAVAVLIVGRRPAAKSSPYALLAPPKIVAGIQSAHVEWETNLPSPSRIAIWESMPYEAVMIGLPGDSDADRRVRHMLNLRQLKPNATLHFRVVFGDGSLSSQSFPLVMRPLDAPPLASGLSFTHRDHGRIDLRWKTAVPLVSGLSLTQSLPGEGTTTTVWDRTDPAKTHTGTVSGLDPAVDATVQAVFGELDDDRVEMGEIPGRAALEKLARNAHRLWPTHTQDVADLALRHIPSLAEKTEGGPPNVAGPVSTWEPAPSTTRAAADDWCQRNLAMGLKQIEQDVPNLLTDVGLPVATRQRVYEAVAPLEVVDEIAMLRHRQSVLGIRPLYTSYLTISYPPKGPEGEHLLASDPRKKLQTYLTDHCMQLPSRNLEDAGGLPGLSINKDLSDTSVLLGDTGEEFLRAADHAYVAQFTVRPHASTGSLIVAVRETNLAPEYWLQVTFDGSYQIYLRPGIEMAARAEMVISPLRLTDSPVEMQQLLHDVRADSTWIEARLPVALLAPGKHEIAIRLDTVSVQLGVHPVRQCCWLADAVVGQAP